MKTLTSKDWYRIVGPLNSIRNVKQALVSGGYAYTTEQAWETIPQAK
jgi:hypothetical protein